MKPTNTTYLSFLYDKDYIYLLFSDNVQQKLELMMSCSLYFSNYL